MLLVGSEVIFSVSLIFKMFKCDRNKEEICGDCCCRLLQQLSQLDQGEFYYK